MNVLRLTAHLFSASAGNMRFPHGRRVLAVLTLLPVFLPLFIVHRLALWLDTMLFPSYRRQAVFKPVFIVAPPRSGTTFLFHTLAAHKKDFTAVKLWEIALAPAICEKYFLLFLARLDGRVGAPVKRAVLRLEDCVLRQLRTIHPLGLQQPEEDEALLLWYLGSGFLHHFFPDTTLLNDLLYFDGGGWKERRKERLLGRYHDLVCRHNYVFNRTGERRFLAKNPFFQGRLASLSKAFPDARILTIDRNPESVVASTLSLNAQLYRIASTVPPPRTLRSDTIDLLLSWGRLARAALDAQYRGRHLRLDFTNLVRRDYTTWAELARFLNLDRDLRPQKKPPASTGRSVSIHH